MGNLSAVPEFISIDPSAVKTVIDTLREREVKTGSGYYLAHNFSPELELVVRTFTKGLVKASDRVREHKAKYSFDLLSVLDEGIITEPEARQKYWDAVKDHDFESIKRYCCDAKSVLISSLAKVIAADKQRKKKAVACMYDAFKTLPKLNMSSVDKNVFNEISEALDFSWAVSLTSDLLAPRPNARKWVKLYMEKYGNPMPLLDREPTQLELNLARAIAQRGLV